MGLVAIMLSMGIINCSSEPDAGEVIGGTFVGYTYSEQAVVETKVEVEYGYTVARHDLSSMRNGKSQAIIIAESSAWESKTLKGMRLPSITTPQEMRSINQLCGHVW